MAERGVHVRKTMEGYVVFDGKKKRSRGYTHEYCALQAAQRLEHAKKLKERACITCGTRFRSEGAHNRMCPRCRTHSADAPYALGTHSGLAR